MYRPIHFNTEMVCAILEGRKTVTRRVEKPQPRGAYAVLGHDDYKRTVDVLCGGVFYDWGETIKAPYWPGDILWVRETWNVKSGIYQYRAFPRTRIEPQGQNTPIRDMGMKWRPSIHMPREVARIFLRVTDLQVERLRDISNDPPGLENQVVQRASSMSATLSQHGKTPLNLQTGPSTAGMPTHGCG